MPVTPFFDNDGHEWEVRFQTYDAITVSCDGMVHSLHIDSDGNREESTTPLYDSPVRGALPEWVWDLTMDPRREAPDAGD